MTNRGTNDSPTWRGRVLDALAWAALLGFFWSIDTWTRLDDLRRLGEVDEFRLYTEQTSSGVSAWVMVAFVAVWLRHFPLDRRKLLVTVVGHVAGSVVFTLGHYFGFVALRRLIFHFAAGSRYMPDQWHLWNLFFEYRKDVPIYLAIVAVLTVVHHLRSQRRERQELDAGASHEAATETEDTSDEPSLLVPTRRGERLLPIRRVEYLEASRNYVVVHTREGGRYSVRATLTAMLEDLPAAEFLQTHRSYVVRRSRLVELKSAGSGYRAVLASEAEVPVSRGFRDDVRECLQDSADVGPSVP